MAAITIAIDPVLWRFGVLAVHWYGLMYAAGILLGLLIVVPYARRRGLQSDDIGAIAWGTGLAALVGGRLYYIAQTDPGFYLVHPAQIVAVWQGGMAFYGALLLGTPTAIVLARRRGLRAGVVLDIAALFAPLSQAVGRIGNVINGDIVGYPSSLPWATIYTSRDNAFVRLGVAYQPAAAYELLFGLGLFGLLWRWRYRAWPPGTLFLLYVVLYAAGQFVLFFWRANTIVAFDLKQAQLTSVVVFVMALPVLFGFLRRRPSHTDSPPGEPVRTFQRSASDKQC